MHQLINVMGGSLTYALGFNLFVVPMSLFSGGFMGVSQLIEIFMRRYLHMALPPEMNVAGILYFLLNVPLFIIGIKSLGKASTLKTLVTVGIQSIFLVMIPVPTTPFIDDYLTACLVGGIVCGVGCGLVLKGRASSGGLEIIGLICTKKYRDFSVGRLSIIMNFFIYAVCLKVVNVQIVIYSLIFATITSLFEDRIHSQNINIGVMIFTKKEGIAATVMTKMGRGVTYWVGAGAYTEEPTYILYIAINKYEIPQIKEIIHGVDPRAFVIYTEGSYIEGNFEKRI